MDAIYSKVIRNEEDREEALEILKDGCFWILNTDLNRKEGEKLTEVVLTIRNIKIKATQEERKGKNEKGKR